MPNDFGSITESLRRSTVAVGSERGGGSGVVWSAGGLIVTNAHVARGDRAQVEFWDGSRAEARVVRRNEARDLAALQVARTGLPAVAARDTASVRPGEWVVAIGNPLGFQGALSTGIVRAVGPVGGLGARQWVQADVRILPGNSGGPLADARGRLVGINTMLAGRLALAIPADTVSAFLRRREAPRLGVEVRPVAVARNTLGLLVLGVDPHSPAERASLLMGDVLMRANGRRFESPADLALAIEDAPDGVLRLEFVRGDASRIRAVTAALHARAAEAA